MAFAQHFSGHIKGSASKEMIGYNILNQSVRPTIDLFFLNRM